MKNVAQLKSWWKYNARWIYQILTKKYEIVKNGVVLMQDMVKSGRANDPNNISGRILY